MYEALWEFGGWIISAPTFDIELRTMFIIDSAVDWFIEIFI
jgi:hypothetical protein